jgi:hypothetical protein
MLEVVSDQLTTSESCCNGRIIVRRGGSRLVIAPDPPRSPVRPPPAQTRLAMNVNSRKPFRDSGLRDACRPATKTPDGTSVDIQYTTYVSCNMRHHPFYRQGLLAHAFWHGVRPAGQMFRDKFVSNGRFHRDRWMFSRISPNISQEQIYDICVVSYDSLYVGRQFAT